MASKNYKQLQCLKYMVAICSSSFNGRVVVAAACSYNKLDACTPWSCAVVATACAVVATA